MGTTCSTCSIVEESDPRLLLAETPFWQIYLSEQQNYPGRCFIPLRRHAPSLGALTPEEWDELQIILGTLETVLCDELQASHVNFSCLMNGAYTSEYPQPHVHFHAVPRFPEPVSFGGMDFVDERYGFHYSLDYDWVQNDQGATEIRELIQDELRDALEAALHQEP